MNNVVKNFKKGHKIHIKESQKGSFTKWCGGNVTSECIQRGKNSSNPKIRKKATFAANARKWKHKEGGLLKFEDGGKNGAPSTKFLSKQWFKNAGDNIGSFLNSDAGKGLLNIGQNILSGYTDYKKASNLLDSQVEQNKASLEKSYQDIMQEALQNKILRQQQLKQRWQQAYQNGETLDNYSDIVAQHVGWDQYSSAIQNAEQQKRQQEALMDQQAKQAKSNALGNLFGSVVQSGLGVLGNVLGKGGTSSIPTTSTSTTAVNNTSFSSPLNDSTKFWSIK